MTNNKKPLIAIDARCMEESPTGTGRYLLNLLKEFAKMADAGDLPFGVVLYFKSSMPDIAVLQNRVFEKKCLRPLFGRESNAIFTHILLPRALKRDRAKALFSPAYIAPWFCPVPIALTLHDISYEAHPEWSPSADRFLLRAVSRHAARNAAAIITISEFSKSEIARLYGMDAGRIRITPLAADQALASEPPAGTAERFLADHGIGKTFVFSVGNMINRRYPIETLRAFEYVARTNPEAQIVLAGIDRTHPSLNIERAISKTNDVLGRKAALCIPRVSDAELAILYHRAKALVWLSSYEGFGLPPMEAMLAGTPVITSNASSIPEVVGDAAILIKETPAGPDVAALESAMEKVLTDEDLRRLLIEKGKDRARLFSWKKTAELTRKIITDTIA
jgi:glycosyltransferase involved in cell wall biosynthesis